MVKPLIIHLGRAVRLRVGGWESSLARAFADRLPLGKCLTAASDGRGQGLSSYARNGKAYLWSPSNISLLGLCGGKIDI